MTGEAAAAGHFGYLSYRDAHLPEVSDEDDFARTVLCLDSIHIDENTQKQVFTLLAGILHLGNVQFGEDDKEGQSGVTAESMGAFTTAGICTSPYLSLYNTPLMPDV